jgi:hypothetical protein
MSAVSEERIRYLISKVLSSNDEEELTRDLQELRAVIHEHLAEAREIMRASYCRNPGEEAKIDSRKISP